VCDAQLRCPEGRQEAFRSEIRRRCRRGRCEVADELARWRPNLSSENAVQTIIAVFASLLGGSPDLVLPMPKPLPDDSSLSMKRWARNSRNSCARYCTNSSSAPGRLSRAGGAYRSSPWCENLSYWLAT